ncbi:MAG: hypothetical protein KAH44_08060 [Oricola sp.]|jgi:hypothetical protein|nr:hypothetical protein [Oricola sp.]
MLTIDPLHNPDRYALVSTAAAAEILRKARETEAASGVMDIATAVTAPESVANEASGVLGEPSGGSITVDLIPGSNRLVTTVLDPGNGAVLFRIPAWLSNSDDLFGDASAMNYL